MVNILGSEGHMVSVVTVQLSCCGMKAAIGSMQRSGHGCISVKLHLHEQVEGQILDPWLKPYEIAIFVVQKWSTIGNFM